MNSFIRKLYWVIAYQLGVDIRKLARSALAIPRYLRDLKDFRKQYSGNISLLPCLHDWYQQSGAVEHEYFWQDLYVARQVYKRNPERHVDVGSRIDGFVAHVASFREIEVIDIRPMSKQIPNVVFKAADLMLGPPAEEYCDSLSCLHTLEHFGLGRYGDPVNPDGWKKGFDNLTRMLVVGGLFYLSVPVGKERVEFNAHRIFSLNSILAAAKENGLELTELVVVDPRNGIQFISEISRFRDESQVNVYYQLAIFTFVKAR